MGRPTKSRLETVYPPRGMRCDRAAAYLGMSEASFLRLVADGVLPRGVHIKGMTVWDRHDLDRAFENLKDSEIRRNTFDQALDERSG